MPIVSKLTGNLTTPYAARLIGSAARDIYDDLAKNTLLPYLRRELPGHFKEKVGSRITGQGLNTQLVIYSNERGIKQIEEGRAPGKQPPPNVLLKWVQKHGLGANAQSIKTRRSLAVGVRRIRNTKTGKLRTKVQSLLVRQKSIAFAIGRNIAKEGLPRNTGFKPSHALFLFRDMKQNNATEVNAATLAIQAKIVAILNA